MEIIEARIKHCDLTKKIESININELLEDLAEILKERKFVKIIESRIEHCDLTKKYLWSGDDGADLSSSFSRASDERSWLADGNPAGVPKSKKFVKSL